MLSGDGGPVWGHGKHNNVKMLNATLSMHFKMVKMVDFVLYIFYCFKKS